MKEGVGFMGSPTTKRIPAQRIADSLINAMFPQGERLQSADKQVVTDSVDGYLSAFRGLRTGVGALLWWLELRCVLTTGRRFSKASQEQQNNFLKKIAPSLLSGSLLRILSLPFKAAYVFDDKNTEQLDCRETPETPAAIEQHRWQQQVSSAADFDADEEMEADVVIVGTGAGGAAAAYELASRGLAVVMIEEGKYFDRKDFAGSPIERALKLYRGAPMTVGNTVMPIPIGKTVGGSTTVNSGTAMRTPDKVLQEWQERGITGLSKEELESYFQSVEEVINVEEAEVKFVGEIAKAVTEGANALGMNQTKPLPRNAKGCDGQGTCIFGCPTDAKQSTNVSYVPRALDNGAFLFTEFRATQLLRNGKQVEGIIAEGIGSEGTKINMTIKARKTIISMGTLLTPVFLKKNGIKNRNLGANLTVHPATNVTGWYPDREFDNSRTIPQGFSLKDLQDEGITFEGATLPFFAHGLLSQHMGDDYIEFAERYQQMGFFAFMIKETSHGTVRRGLLHDYPFITYNINKHDLNLISKGTETLARIHFKAGAKEVYIPGITSFTTLHNEEELDRFIKRNRSARNFALLPFHPLGTVRVGANAKQGVCDTDHKVFGWEGLYVMDGSSVPSSLGANPQVTIMALASRAARKLADSLAA